MARRASHPVWDRVRARLREAGDPGVAERVRVMAPTGGVVLGIGVPALRAMAKEVAAEMKGAPLEELVKIGDVAFESGCREEMLVATFVLGRFKSKLEPEQWARMNGWVDRIDTWETCDQLATGVAGEMIARASSERREAWTRDLERWAESENRWRRRFAVATTTTLNQKGREDCATALRICARLLGDSDVNVRKAVAWALREACKSDASAVFEFLRKRRGEMPRTVLRQSAEKLTAAQRAALGLA